MKNINFSELKSKVIIIDPSINLNNELEELINIFKIKIISHSDNEEILTNLYFIMKTYFNEIVCDEILKCCLGKSQHRDLLISLILKNKN
jgi:siroheme synthase (precorrin-2 oxidase/ferrochelatase)